MRKPRGLQQVNNRACRQCRASRKPGRILGGIRNQGRQLRVRAGTSISRTGRRRTRARVLSQGSR